MPSRRPEGLRLKDLIAVLDADEEGQKYVDRGAGYLHEINIFAIGTKMDELIQKGRTTIINFRNLQISGAGGRYSATFAGSSRPVIFTLVMVCEEATTTARNKASLPAARYSPHHRLGGAQIRPRSHRHIAEGGQDRQERLSQCNTQMILKVTNPNDLEGIANSLEGLSEEWRTDQRLPIGVALIIGANIQMPLFVEVRPRESRHGGESVEIIHQEVEMQTASPMRRSPSTSKPRSARSTRSR
jgi:hypothetical protein